MSRSPSSTVTTVRTQAEPSSRDLPSKAPQTRGTTGFAYSSVNLRYLERSPILVLGPATGRRYEFSGAKPVQSVDTRDLEALLRTRFFRRD